ncbi:MAG TPA: HIT family protein, partial [Planctomycetota bacterium]|nr:HIT family protein [Planctomycetota bacterium]
MPKPAGCLFCSIIRGETPAQTVLDDKIALAFLDHRPLFPGHCLIVPKTHYETLTDLPPELLGPLFERAQSLARAVEVAMQATGTFVAMNNRVSQSVPHLHIHVVPRRPKDGLKGFFWP